MFISEEWGEGVFRYTISNGEYSASVLNLGAILQSFRLKDHDVVCGFDSLDGYRSQDAYMGQVVGPIANRIENGTFTIDGKRYEIEKNERGTTANHSASKNFGYEIWKLAGHSDASVTLTLVSEPKAGFDQRIEVMVTYFLTGEGELIIDYQLLSDRKCPVNITNHTYWHLGDGDIRDTVASFKADRYVASDEFLIPTGIADTAGTDFDFSTPHAIGERRDGKYDTCFDLDGIATFEKNGLRLSVRTSMPGLHIYTGEFLSSRLEGKEGHPYGPFDGVALETSYYPNFFNRNDFKGEYLEPGEVYRSSTTYKLEEIQ